MASFICDSEGSEPEPDAADPEPPPLQPRSAKAKTAVRAKSPKRRRMLKSPEFPFLILPNAQKDIPHCLSMQGAQPRFGAESSSGTATGNSGVARKSCPPKSGGEAEKQSLRKNLGAQVKTRTLHKPKSA